MTGIMTGSRNIRRFSRQRGFTLLETLIVVGLTAMIAVGIVAALIEGLDTLQTVADTQAVEFRHQRIMNTFMTDVKNATWFYNGTTHDGGGTEVPRTNTSSRELMLGYEGPEGSEIWVRYRTRPGYFRLEDHVETYLMRTVLADTFPGDGSSYMASGIANLEFEYFDADGNFEYDLSQVKRIIMTISLVSGGTTIERSYEAVLRNRNMGVRTPPRDFNDVENEFLNK